MRTRLLRSTLFSTLAFAVFLALPHAAGATTTVPNTLSGTVYDFSTGAPLGGVEVRLYDATTAWSGGVFGSVPSTFTAPDGTYTIDGINGSNWFVIAFVDHTGNYRDSTAPLRGFHIRDSFGWIPDSLVQADGLLVPLGVLDAGRTYRVSGPDRYSTAAAISAVNFASSDEVILANGNAFADSLSAASLAGVLDCPLLLVTSDTIPSSVRAELGRLGARHAVIVGGPVSVGGAVESALSGMGITQKRISGSDRYAVSANVALELWNHYMGYPHEYPGAYVCRGDVFADALSVSPFAFSEIAPILLTDPSGLSPEVASAFDFFTRETGNDVITVVGGKVSVPDAIIQQFADVSATGGVGYSRLAGNDRYSTGRAVVEAHLDWYGMKGFDSVAIASGEVFPDALAGGVAQGRRGGALMLTQGASLGSNARSVLQSSGPYIMDSQCFGGPVTLAPSTVAAADVALGSTVYDINSTGERIALPSMTSASSIVSPWFAPRRGFGPPTVPRSAGVTGVGVPERPDTAVGPSGSGFGGDETIFLGAAN